MKAYDTYIASVNYTTEIISDKLIFIWLNKEDILVTEQSLPQINQLITNPSQNPEVSTAILLYPKENSQVTFNDPETGAVPQEHATLKIKNVRFPGVNTVMAGTKVRVEAVVRNSKYSTGKPPEDVYACAWLSGGKKPDTEAGKTPILLGCDKISRNKLEPAEEVSVAKNFTAPMVSHPNGYNVMYCLHYKNGKDNFRANIGCQKDDLARFVVKIPAPDLSVSNLSINTTIAGQPQFISANISNLNGNAITTPATVIATIDGVEAGRVYLTAQEIATKKLVEFTQTAKAGNHTIQVCIQTTQEDANVSNNCMTANNNIVDLITATKNNQPLLIFSNRGVINGMHCISVNEANDPHFWGDNYLCSDQDYGFIWSTSGAIPKMRCTQITESDPNGWDNNYLCLPWTSNLYIQWFTAGVSNKGLCTAWNEFLDPYWSDNALCWGVSIKRGIGFFPAFRFFNASMISHFYTTNPNEWLGLVNDPSLSKSWSYEYIEFWAATSPDKLLVPVYRYWHDTRGHVFVLDGERAAVEAAGWKFEKIAFYASSKQNSSAEKPVYRLRSPLWTYFYTTSIDETITAKNYGYVNEGIVFYVAYTK